MLNRRSTSFYLKELPLEYHDDVDVLGFALGERIVFEPYTREVFQTTRDWMKTNDLFEETTAVEDEQAVLV
jgi:hypothetical protein